LKNKNHILFLSFILFFCFPPFLIGQEYFNENFIRYTNYIYKPNIKTVLLYKKGFELSLPIINLNKSEQLELSFDDFETNVKDYYYTIIHCDANWTPTDIINSEYITGFTEDRVTEYKYSINTVQSYINYKITFPNENLNISKSGNYIIKVFEDFDKDNLVLTQRFVVTEDIIDINVKVKRNTIAENLFTKHEIDFSLNTKNLNINNAKEDIKIILSQNNRWDNSIINLKPSFISQTELTYDYYEENTFFSGNEYRYFSIKSLYYYSERIDEITRTIQKNDVYLFKDMPRRYLQYDSYQDINGKRVINIQDKDNSSIEADYTWVHFSLDYPNPLVNGNLYVFGELTNWNIGNDNKMKYNYDKKCYEVSLYLKQGYYNYEYVYLDDSSKVLDNTFIEGSFYQTENDYTVYVYYKEPGKYYYRLIGVKQVNTKDFY